MYKVCTTIDGRHFSSSTSGNQPVFPEVEYFVGEKTYPLLGKLFVFEHLSDAAIFANRPYETVWECEVENPELIFRAACWRDDYELFWNDSDDVDTFLLVWGTYAVDSVTLLREEHG